MGYLDTPWTKHSGPSETRYWQQEYHDDLEDLAYAVHHRRARDAEDTFWRQVLGRLRRDGVPAPLEVPTTASGKAQLANLINAAAKSLTPAYYDYKPASVNYAIRSVNPSRGEAWWAEDDDGMSLYRVKDRHGIQFSFHDPGDEVAYHPRLGLALFPGQVPPQADPEPWIGLDLQPKALHLAASPRYRGRLASLSEADLIPRQQKANRAFALGRGWRANRVFNLRHSLRWR